METSLALLTLAIVSSRLKYVTHDVFLMFSPDIPPFTRITSDVITGMSVTQSVSRWEGKGREGKRREGEGV